MLFCIHPDINLIKTLQFRYWIKYIINWFNEFFEGTESRVQGTGLKGQGTRDKGQGTRDRVTRSRNNEMD
jgi:hypothetical protein